jgi:hypothetical protein
MSKEKTGQRHKNKIYFRDLDLYRQAFPLNLQTYGALRPARPSTPPPA